MEAQQQQQPQQDVAWPVVMPGKELNMACREFLLRLTIYNIINAVVSQASQGNQNLQMTRCEPGVIVSLVRSFLGPPPGKKSAIGTGFVSVSHVFTLPDEGSLIDCRIANPYFSGHAEECFWTLETYFEGIRHNKFPMGFEALVKFKLLSDMPALAPNANGAMPRERDGQLAYVPAQVEQCIRLNELPEYFEIVPDWREWIPADRLQNGVWQFHYREGWDYARVLGNHGYDSDDYVAFKFVKFAIGQNNNIVTETESGSGDWYCYYVYNLDVRQFKVGLALVSQQDATTLELDNKDWNSWDWRRWKIRP